MNPLPFRSMLLVAVTAAVACLSLACSDVDTSARSGAVSDGAPNVHGPAGEGTTHAASAVGAAGAEARPTTAAANPPETSSASNSEALGGTGPGASGSGRSPQAPSGEGGMPASVIQVRTAGSAGEYSFTVTVSSGDTGCDRYADWWEVVDRETGGLVYRRILLHSHVTEQPFSRSGGPVDVRPDQPLIIRAHMSGSAGYDGEAMTGTVDGGFAPAGILGSHAELVTQEPLPDGCDF